MSRVLVPVLVLCLVITGCGAEPTPTPDLVARRVATERAAAATLTAEVPTATDTLEPTSAYAATPTTTSTIAPSSTPTSTETPAPTRKPNPTETPTPTIMPTDTSEATRTPNLTDPAQPSTLIPSGNDTWTRPADGAVMVYVPAGEFLMGSNGDAPSHASPQHTVYLDAYWIDSTEVTNAQYRQCVEEGACQAPWCWDDDNLNAPDQPVVCVSWDEARQFAAWAGGRLPTEAEWEKAARGTDGRIYPWGDEYDCREANISGTDCDDYEYTAPVGSFPAGASPYGALDMAGNVWEWTRSLYEPYPYRSDDGREDLEVIGARVMRGGSFTFGNMHVRSAVRGGSDPYHRRKNVGFRVCIAARQERSASIPTRTQLTPPLAARAGDTWTRPADGAAMVYVPAGEFLMGSTEPQVKDAVAMCVADGNGEADCKGWFQNETPQHTVYLDGFWIDKTEVTNVQYVRCMDVGACQELECLYTDGYNETEQPVVCVSWDEARQFAAWAGGRLPTEAEWEKAARGTDGRVYPWGNSTPDCDRADYYGCADGPLPVDSHPDGASPYGALDMAGNVWEWVADWHDEAYYTHSPLRNPPGPDSGDFRVLRGGAFNVDDSLVRCAVRGRGSPTNRSYPIGFRVVVAPGPAGP